MIGSIDWNEIIDKVWFFRHRWNFCRIIQNSKVIWDSHRAFKKRLSKISSFSDIYDFVISFNEVDNLYDYSPIDGIFVELFKKANDFDIWHRQFKRSRKIQ